MNRKKALENLDKLREIGIITDNSYGRYLDEVENSDKPKIEVVEIKSDSLWERLKKMIDYYFKKYELKFKLKLMKWKKIRF